MSDKIQKGTDTEDHFRRSDIMRAELEAFLRSECGERVMSLLRQKAKIASPKQPVPHEAVASYSIAELSRLTGLQQAIDLIQDLTSPVVQVQSRVTPMRLGDPSDVGLPEKFKVSKP